jgi:hypothetical protein
VKYRFHLKAEPEDSLTIIPRLLRGIRIRFHFILHIFIYYFVMLCMALRSSGPAGGGGGGGGAFLVSPEMEDVVALRSTTRGRQPSAEQLSTHALSIIVAGAACLAHWEQVCDRIT